MFGGADGEWGFGECFFFRFFFLLLFHPTAEHAIMSRCAYICPSKFVRVLILAKNFTELGNVIFPLLLLNLIKLC
jgi:hypothetical protein